MGGGGGAVQADLGLRCPHMPEDTFLHGPARFIHRAEN